MKVITYFVAILLATVLFTVLIGIAADRTQSKDLDRDYSVSGTSENFISLVGTANTLSNTTFSDYAASSLTATVKNRTWLEFDGVNDYIFISYNNTISFWFRNFTTEWTHLINSSGTAISVYINGTKDNSWNYFPFYSNGTHWIIGKSNASAFENVSIDNIQIYNEWINETKATEIYNEGR